MGRRDTLRKVALTCAGRPEWWVVSDEIHGEQMLGKRRHVAFASVSDDAGGNSDNAWRAIEDVQYPKLVDVGVKNPSLRKPYTFPWLEANEFNAPTMTACIGAEGGIHLR